MMFRICSAERQCGLRSTGLALLGLCVALFSAGCRETGPETELGGRWEGFVDSFGGGEPLSRVVVELRFGGDEWEGDITWHEGEYTRATGEMVWDQGNSIPIDTVTIIRGNPSFVVTSERVVEGFTTSIAGGIRDDELKLSVGRLRGNDSHSARVSAVRID